MVHHFDHRWATYDESGAIRDVTLAEHDDPHFVVRPRYWLAAPEVDRRLSDRSERSWLFGWRRVARSTDVRTIIAPALSRLPTTDKLVLNFTTQPSELLAAYSALVLDFVARQKAGGTQIDQFVARQLPILGPETLTRLASWVGGPVADWIRTRVLELTYTAWDMEPFARDLDDSGPPFRWDDERRAVLRAELDGAFFHLYGIERDDADYIMSTFPIVHRNDQARHGEHRTWRLVMDAYDGIAKAIGTGEPFRSTLDPPPGHGPRHPAW